MKTFNGKVIVVTGAASGIGRALAQEFARRGALLALADWDEEGLAQTRATLGTSEVLAAQLDVADRAAVCAFRDQIIARFGRVDALFNNAGVAVAQRIGELSYEDFEWIVNINFWGVVHGTKAFLPELQRQPEAAIVNTSSVFGLIAVPTQGAYNATKFAVRGFTEALRHELAGSTVHAMCVHPGGIRTNIARNARTYVGPDGKTGKEANVRQFDKVARTTPERAAALIIAALQKKRGRCLVGADAHVIDWLARLLPEHYWSLLRRLMLR